jgi:hypothetical protein
MIFPQNPVDHPCAATEMAPNLAALTLAFIHDFIVSNKLTVPQMVEAADCSERTIRRLRSNMRLFGSVKAPRNRRGRP